MSTTYTRVTLDEARPGDEVWQAGEWTPVRAFHRFGDSVKLEWPNGSTHSMPASHCPAIRRATEESTTRRIMLEGTFVPLDAEITDEGWNGYHVPILTRDQLADYLAACKRNDPNGEWDERPVEEMTPGPFATRRMRLPYWDAPEDRDADLVWDQCEDVMTADGYRSGYAVDGMVWVDYSTDLDAPESGE